MKAFNLYYKSMKINKKPLSKSDIEYIFDQKVIYKKNEQTNKIEKIKTQDLNCVKCIII